MNFELCTMYCNGRKFEIPINGQLNQDALLINQVGNRKWFFSIVGNNPVDPKVALVGLCPAYTQLSGLIKEYNESGISFSDAANCSGFLKMRKNIAKILRKLKIDVKFNIEIIDDYDFNNSPYFYTTSLVKCASLKEGKGRSNDYDILKYECSKLCLINRFIEDILNPKYKNLSEIVFFGKQAEFSVNQNILSNGRSVKELLEEKGKNIYFVPHPSGNNNGRIAKFLTASF